MAHFAWVVDGLVNWVHVVNNNVITDEDGVELEELGSNFLRDLHKRDAGEYIQCSYNNNFRGSFPGIGWEYDEVNDVFVKPVYSEFSEEN